MSDPMEPNANPTEAPAPVPAAPPAPAPSPAPRSSRGSARNVLLALGMALVVLLSGAAGFGGGLIASGLAVQPTVAPTATPTAAAVPTATGTPAATGTPSAIATGLTLAEIAAKDVPAVVQLDVTMTVTVRGRTYTVQGAGAGILLTQDGFLVTCSHVVDGGTKIVATLSDGTQHAATLVGADATNDVAVLKIAATGLPVAEVGRSSDLVVGDEAIAIGNPLELGNTVTQGIISSLSRRITMDSDATMTLLQTDAAINPGNSGGGLFNSAGQLIGIVVAKSSGSNIEGLGFAIPIDHVKAWIESTIAGGRV